MLERASQPASLPDYADHVTEYEAPVGAPAKTAANINQSYIKPLNSEGSFRRINSKLWGFELALDTTVWAKFHANMLCGCLQTA